VSANSRSSPPCTHYTLPAVEVQPTPAASEHSPSLTLPLSHSLTSMSTVVRLITRPEGGANRSTSLITTSAYTMRSSRLTDSSGPYSAISCRADQAGAWMEQCRNRRRSVCVWSGMGGRRCRIFQQYARKLEGGGGQHRNVTAEGKFEGNVKLQGRHWHILSQPCQP